MRTTPVRPLLFLGLAAIFLAVAGSSPREKATSTGDTPDVGWVPRHIQYSFTVQNETGLTIDKVDLWTFAPIDQEKSQRRESLAASHSHELVTDTLGNPTLHFVFLEVPPYATKVVTVRADLLLSALPRPAGIRDLGAFLNPERFIESDDPAILRLAGNLRGASGGETAERIFAWVAANIRYAGYLPHDRGALYALKHRKGDCSEFAALFAACCRANGIPARVVGGIVCGSDSILKAGDYHNWAEFNVDGAWTIADPQRRVFRGAHSHYVAMHVMEAVAGRPGNTFPRFRVEGEGIVVGMKQ
jgi:transglutaminase-like putative cysteine protease